MWEKRPSRGGPARASDSALHDASPSSRLSASVAVARLALAAVADLADNHRRLSLLPEEEASNRLYAIADL